MFSKQQVKGRGQEQKKQEGTGRNETRPDIFQDWFLGFLKDHAIDSKGSAATSTANGAAYENQNERQTNPCPLRWRQFGYLGLGKRRRCAHRMVFSYADHLIGLPVLGKLVAPG
jgi:hypothetical protein